MRRLAQPVLTTLAALVALLVLATPDIAHARWLRAESERFIVYSDGDERTLREYVRRLEIYDWVLRSSTGLPPREGVPRKLPIYLVGGHDDLEVIRPGLAENVAGFYFPANEEIFAAAVRMRREDTLLFHEYAHHFMHQHFSAAYPGWYVEGFAEYFMTVDIGDEDIDIGKHEPMRAAWLVSGDWIEMERFLTARPLDFTNPEDRAVYYGMAWLLTHWFHSDPERNRQLAAYLTAVAGGEPSVDAIQRVTGMTLQTLTRTLRTYLRGALPYAVGDIANAPQSTIEITTLPASADDLLLLSLRLRVGTAEEYRDETLRAVQAAAQRHPDDPFARLTLGHAELHFGDRATGVQILEALVEARLEDIEALQFLAVAYFEQARDAEGPERIRLLNQSNRLLARALPLDPDDYRTFYYLGRNREGSPTYPTDNDLATWAAAYELAPQLPGVRFGLGRALMHLGRFEEAIVVLGPVANSPHGGAAATDAARLIEEARAGRPPTPYSPPEEDS